MIPDDLDQKRNHTLYLTNEAIAMADEMAEDWGIPRNAIFEQAIRAMYHARSALTYEVARQQALEELRREQQEREGE